MKEYKVRENRVIEEGKPLFGILCIIPNVIAIAVFIGAYYYFIYSQQLFPDYTSYIYWTMKILVGYNIIAASARSFVAPILTIGCAVLCLFTSEYYAITLVAITSAEAYQLILIGVIGLLITIMLKLK